jgi:hypothetical protein
MQRNIFCALVAVCLIFAACPDGGGDDGDDGAGTGTGTGTGTGNADPITSLANSTTSTPGLYAKAPPILASDTPVAGVAANDVAAAWNYVKNHTTTPYTLLINDDNTVTAMLTVGNNVENFNLTIEGLGAERTIRGNTTRELFDLTQYATNSRLALGDNITLTGNGSTQQYSLVSIDKGRFTMYPGSKITGFTTSATGQTVSLPCTAAQ